MARLAITWLGHSTFLVGTPGAKQLLFDPWLTGNPACPAEYKKPPRADLILASHGHFDHIGDLVPCARASGATVIGAYELCEWLGRKGIQNLAPMNKGGSQEIGSLRITMTDARHSSGYVDASATPTDGSGHMLYMGEPAGFVVRLEDGRAIYYAGDTAVFGDMRLIGQMYAPEIAFLPIGGRFTMDPSAAAIACELLGVRQVVPMHWGTFPLLTGTPSELKTRLAGTRVEVLELKPGETAD